MMWSEKEDCVVFFVDISVKIETINYYKNEGEDDKKGESEFLFLHG